MQIAYLTIFKPSSLLSMLRLKNIVFLSLIAVFLCSCKSDNGYEPIVPIAVHPNGMEYIHTNTCMECHKEIVENHQETAHWLTSSIASEKTIKGSFANGKNSFSLNEQISFRMVKTDSGFFQEPFSTRSDHSFYSAPMDMVIGSGTKGQSYLLWDEDALFQLQASYFTPTDSWINSPGYPAQLLKARPVPGRCLECHATYIDQVDQHYNNRFDKTSLVIGIDCIRCHGDVKNHVAYHRKKPFDTVPKFVMSYKNLDRTQRLDACALCHSGLRQVRKKDNFSFMPGDKLDAFSLPDYDESGLPNLDVHGNQYGLLKASECFKKSETMDCVTCHNPHKTERGRTQLFNSKCLSCHKDQTTHHLSNGTLNINYTDCINCHMPLQASNVMKIQISHDSLVAVKVRSHLIKIYESDSIN